MNYPLTGLHDSHDTAAGQTLGATCLAIKTKQVGGATEFDWWKKILIFWSVPRADFVCVDTKLILWPRKCQREQQGYSAVYKGHLQDKHGLLTVRVLHRRFLDTLWPWTENTFGIVSHATLCILAWNFPASLQGFPNSTVVPHASYRPSGIVTRRLGSRAGLDSPAAGKFTFPAWLTRVTVPHTANPCCLSSYNII